LHPLSLAPIATRCEREGFHSSHSLTCAIYAISGITLVAFALETSNGIDALILTTVVQSSGTFVHVYMEK
jgi:accessory gene regulator protein AgrB